MPQLLICARLIAMLGLLAPFSALAQEASQTEQESVSRIARCLAQGLPEDWVAAHMVVELRSPGASTGGVRYLVARKGKEDQFEAFTPCDTSMPAEMLIDLRVGQPRERQGWTSARLVLERDGSFRLNYDFPK